VGQTYLYRLNPKGSFHFGVQGLGLEESSEFCPSDTLYSALLTTALVADRPFFRPSANASAAQPLEPPYLLSSCLPYVENVLLFPRPLLPLPLPALEPLEQQKFQQKLKKVKYVSQTIFELLLKQDLEGLKAYLPAKGTSKGELYLENSVWIAHSDDNPNKKVIADTRFWQIWQNKPFWQKKRMAHSIVDREQRTNEAYEIEQVFFAEGCGMAVLCQERLEGAAQEFGELLQELGESGLGGKRSSGLGQFTVSGPVALTLPEPKNPKRMVLLSRYRPSQDELAAGVLGAEARYELVSVGGYFHSLEPGIIDQLRAKVWFLKEGSLLQLPSAGQPIGTICDVRPRTVSHPVWRYGLSLGVRA